MTRPTASTGALVGLLLTAPLAAVLFLAHRAWGAPFVPGDLFATALRPMPGVAELEGTAQAALAVTLFLAGGAASAAVVFDRIGARGGRFALFPSLLLGAALGVGWFLLALRVDGLSRSQPFTSGLWVVLMFLVWGLALGRSHDHLAGASANPRKDGGGPPTEERAHDPAHAQQPAALRRQRFLPRLAVASVLITLGATAASGLLRG